MRTASSTPRVAKSVHYEDMPPPRAFFPLEAPFNTRMVGFGLPDLSVPKDYLGPRRGVWDQTAHPSPPASKLDLDRALRSDLAEDDPEVARVESYDLTHQTMGPGSSGVMRQACLLWKQPARRRAMRSLLLAHAQLDDAAVHVLARWVSQAPSAPAPLRLQRLQLDDNEIWAGGAAKLLEAFAHNSHASVERIEANNCHVGALAGNIPVPGAAAPTKDHHATGGGGHGAEHGDGAAGAHAGDTSPTAAANHAAALAGASAAAATAAASCFQPLVSFLSTPHCALRVLCLSQCGLSDLFAAYLAEGLRSNNTLVELHLDSNLIGDAGAKLIAQALGGRRAEEAAAEAAALAAATQALEAATLAAAEEARAGSAANPSGRPSSRNGRTPKAGSSASTLAPGSASGGGGPGHRSTGSKDVTGKKLTFSPDLKEGDHAPGEGDEWGGFPGAGGAPVPLPVFPANNGCNASLRVLSLRSNRIGVVGLAHLLSMVRLHPSLLRCHVAPQRGIASFDTERHETLVTEVAAACEANAYAPLRDTKIALALAFHPRVGRCSSVRALVEGARAMAEGEGADARSPSALSFDAGNSNNGSRAHSRTSFHPTTRAQDGSASNDPDVSSSTASLLCEALQQVWQFIGYEQ